VLDAIESALGQTCAPDEVIVVESKSELMIPPKSLPAKVRLITSSSTLSPGASRNRGAEAASSEYLAFLDDDDLWDFQYLEFISSAILLASSRGNRPNLLHGDLVDEQGTSRRNPKFSSERAFFFLNPGITGSNLVVRREFFEGMGGFDVAIAPSEDRDFLARTYLAGVPFIYVREARAVIRAVSGERISNRFLRSALAFIFKYWRVTKPSEKVLAFGMIGYKFASAVKRTLRARVSPLGTRN